MSRDLHMSHQKPRTGHILNWKTNKNWHILDWKTNKLQNMSRNIYDCLLLLCFCFFICWKCRCTKYAQIIWANRSVITLKAKRPYQKFQTDHLFRNTLLPVQTSNLTHTHTYVLLLLLCFPFIFSLPKNGRQIIRERWMILTTKYTRRTPRTLHTPQGQSASGAVGHQDTPAARLGVWFRCRSLAVLLPAYPDVVLLAVGVDLLALRLQLLGHVLHKLGHLQRNREGGVTSWWATPEEVWGKCERSQNWVNFLCWLLFRYLFHPRATAVARKRPRSFCQKRGWQVTAEHAYTLRMWLLHEVTWCMVV